MLSPSAPLILVAVIFAATFPSSARGAESGGNPGAAGPLKQEVAGLELSPVSLGTGARSVGVGATLRLGRHRWPGIYWTPIQVGFFAGGPGWKETVLFVAQTEAGLVRRFGLGTIEAGLGVGPGALGMKNDVQPCNEGDCGVGGMGVMFSPVIRFLLRERATHTIATFVRAEIPAGTTQGETTINLRGFGMTFLFGLDLAGGWG
ncbi:MAG TPA: hypothetical protein VHU40_04660 [Polyangia bacterium]|jgi:hypothetical protein|nr:hypothetical protein [Polyangia bacterium]